jgi:hypothetical protein
MRGISQGTDPRFNNENKARADLFVGALYTEFRRYRCVPGRGKGDLGD